MHAWVHRARGAGALLGAIDAPAPSRAFSGPGQSAFFAYRAGRGSAGLWPLGALALRIDTTAADDREKQHAHPDLAQAPFALRPRAVAPYAPASICRWPSIGNRHSLRVNCVIFQEARIAEYVNWL